MNQVLSRIKQAEACRIFKAAARSGRSWRIEFRPDGTIVATSCDTIPEEPSGVRPAETPDQLRKLI
jgi:hypothetical protein